MTKAEEEVKAAECLRISKCNRIRAEKEVEEAVKAAEYHCIRTFLEAEEVALERR